MSGHAIVHVEVPSVDPAAAAKFYSDLFGWKLNPWPEFNDFTFDTGGGLPVIEPEKGVTAGEVLVYVNTNDLDASLARVRELGGRVDGPQVEVSGMRWAFFNDPSGNRVGLYTGAPAAQQPSPASA
ncbi:MAG: VOC family protein [Anaerolineales bacterium]|nr:VOC family protein [Anaerolineales bacterium]